MSSYMIGSLERIVEDVENLNKSAETIAKDVIQNKMNIVELIQKLDFSLTSLCVETRVNGTYLLSYVLNYLPKDYLNTAQLNCLTTFYSERCKEHHSALPAVILGLNSLITQNSLSCESVALLLNSLFENTTCQSQMRNDRLIWFQILKNITEKYANDLNYTCNLMSSIDGERDPRNLDYIFTFMPNVLKKFRFLNLAEEMFEIFACYFPIDFTPSYNDPENISREILADKLANCLVASPYFTEWTINLALDKIETEVLIAKLDAITLLLRAIENFPSQEVIKYFEKIWIAIKTYLIPGTDNEDIKLTSMLLLRLLFEKTTESEITLVLTEILPKLNDVNQKLFHAAASIALLCIVAAPKYTTFKILNIFLIKLQNLNFDDELRVKIYVELTQIFRIIAHQYNLHKADELEICQTIQDDVINTLKLNISESNTEMQIVALNLATEGAFILNERQRLLLYQIFTKIILDETFLLTEEIKQLIIKLATMQPFELQSHYLNICVQHFHLSNKCVKIKILSSFLALIKIKDYTKHLMDFILLHIFNTNEKTTLLLTLETFNKLLSQEISGIIREIQYTNELISKFIEFRMKLASFLKTTDDEDWSILAEFGTSISLLLKPLDLSQQIIIANAYLPHLIVETNIDFFVIFGLLYNLHKDVDLDIEISNLLPAFIKLATNPELPKRWLQIVQLLLCNLANKIHVNSKSWRILLDIVVNLREKIYTSISSTSTLAWVAKGLIVRGAKEANDIIYCFLELLDGGKESIKIGIHGFGIIAENGNINLPLTKTLYKQKFFHCMLSALQKKIIDDISFQHLTVFMIVMKTTPYTVLHLHIEKIGPLLLKCLNVSFSLNTLEIALEICNTFIKQQDIYFSLHLTEIISSCLSLVQNSQSMHIRISVLKLLEELTNYKLSLLLPHKLNVVMELSGSLNDRKRWVRQAAVQARNAWYLVDTNNF